MGILMPLTIPLTWAILGNNDMAGEAGLPILYAAVSTILAGAVWGDHCSPISDTTVLSSLASQCDHIDQVRTQAPYALVAGGVSIVFGWRRSAFGTPWWIALPISAAALVALLVWVGRPVPETTPEPAATAAAVAALPWHVLRSRGLDEPGRPSQPGRTAGVALRARPTERNGRDEDPRRHRRLTRRRGGAAVGAA